MQSWKGVKYDSSGTVISCIFCRICDKLEPAAIVSENNKFVAFKNIAPVTKDHLLIAPRNHFKNCSSLEGEQGARLIEEMLEVFILSIIITVAKFWILSVRKSCTKSTR